MRIEQDEGYSVVGGRRRRGKRRLDGDENGTEGKELCRIEEKRILLQEPGARPVSLLLTCTNTCTSGSFQKRLSPESSTRSSANAAGAPTAHWQYPLLSDGVPST